MINFLTMLLGIISFEIHLHKDNYDLTKRGGIWGWDLNPVANVNHLYMCDSSSPTWFMS